MLAGKYTHADLEPREGADHIGSRREVAAGNGSLPGRGLAIADVVKQVAAEHGGFPHAFLTGPMLQSLLVAGATVRPRA